MKLKFIIIQLFIFFAVGGQDFVMKKSVADRYYNRFDYYKAIPMYEQLLNAYPGNYEINEKLADSYRKINDSRNSEKYYAVLVDTTLTKPEYLLYYAQVLARNGRYDQSKIWYGKYAELVPDDSRGREFSVAYQNLSEFYRDSTSFSIQQMPFCTDASDFGTAYYDKGLIFSSSLHRFSIIRLFYNWTSSSYLDLYFALPDSVKAIPFSKNLNSIYHEGPVTFTQNQDTIVFTRSNFYKWRFRKSNEGINKLKMFQAVWDENQKDWTNISPLPFNNDQYSVGHPSLSRDGGRLFYASDLPGGVGGTDIYYSERTIDSTGNRTWGTPVNMGVEINTSGNEMFPFIDNEGNLWYASNGMAGLGGLDVFMSTAKNYEFGKPVNPGYPVNTSYDDFAFVTQNAGKDGYISSDRFNNVGNDDIYKVRRISNNLIVFVYDQENNIPLPYTNIVVAVAGQEPESKICNASGQTKIVVKPSKTYEFIVIKDKYEENKSVLTAEKLAELDTLKIKLTKHAPKIRMNGKVYSADNMNPIANANAVLVNKTDNSTDTKISDQEGAFSFDLKPEAEYIIKVAIDEPDKKCSSNAIERSTKGIAGDLILSESFPVFCVGDVIKVENIYYDLGKFNIRSDAAIELDKLYNIMVKYPKMKIELRSHTDSRGTPASNMTLSDKRALAASEYLYSKGISRDRIIGKGYGDTMPLNNCLKGVKCSEEEYKVNRRTEFKILSME